jgi:hypothetical protein
VYTDHSGEEGDASAGEVECCTAHVAEGFLSLEHGTQIVSVAVFECRPDPQHAEEGPAADEQSHVGDQQRRPQAVIHTVMNISSSSKEESEHSLCCPRHHGSVQQTAAAVPKPRIGNPSASSVYLHLAGISMNAAAATLL